MARTIEPTEPSEANRLGIERRLRVFGPLSLLGMWPILRFEYSGRSNPPWGEPFLLLCNHVSIWDPFAIIAAGKKPVHFLATQAAFQEPFIGRVMRMWGAVPKKKFVADGRAIRMLRRWVGAGAPVGMFPEGERSWDGRLRPLQPGLDKLIKLLKVPVVTMRLQNADRFAPRWAVKKRRTRVLMEWDEPRTFERSTPGEEIMAHVQQRLSIPATEEQRWPAYGSKLALGLGNAVYACPSCLALDGLVEHGDVVECRRCSAAWTVTTENVMQSAAGGASTMAIADAMDHVRAHYQQSWVGDEAAFSKDGTILLSEPMSLTEHAEGVEVPLAQGRMRLGTEALEVLGESSFSVPLNELRVATVELRRRLQFRADGDRLYEAHLPSESVVKWAEIANHWIEKTRGEIATA